MYLKKLVAKKGPFREKGFDVRTEDGEIPIAEMGSGHINCGNCNSSRFNVAKAARKIDIGCSKCAWEAHFIMPKAKGLIIVPNGEDPEGDLEDGETALSGVSDGNLTCGNCGQRDFNIIKAGDCVCIGCAKCPWETRFIIPRQKGLISLSESQKPRRRVLLPR